MQQAGGALLVSRSVTGSDPALTGFEVTRTEAGSTVSIGSTGADGRELSDPLAGVPCGGHFYTYTVLARADGVTITTGSVSPSTIYDDVPSEPRDASITTAGTVVTVRWRPPAVNGAILTQYLIERAVDGATLAADPNHPSVAPSPAPSIVRAWACWAPVCTRSPTGSSP